MRNFQEKLFYRTPPDDWFWFLKNGDILSEESKVVNIFNRFFSNIVKELKIENNDNLLFDIIEDTNLVLKELKNRKIIQVFCEEKAFLISFFLSFFFFFFHVSKNKKMSSVDDFSFQGESQSFSPH